MKEKEVKVVYHVELEGFRFGENMKELVQLQLGKLTKLIPGSVSAVVRAKKPNSKGKDVKIEITINDKIRTEVSTKFQDFELGIKQSLKKIKAQTDNYYKNKTKQSVKNIVEEDIVVDNVFVKEKYAILDDITKEEALERMFLSGHELFYIYRDVDTKEVCVLYKRNNGGYGVIHTK